MRSVIPAIEQAERHVRSSYNPNTFTANPHIFQMISVVSLPGGVGVTRTDPHRTGPDDSGSDARLRCGEDEASEETSAMAT
jgi:hypothetical protein